MIPPLAITLQVFVLSGSFVGTLIPTFGTFDSWLASHRHADGSGVGRGSIICRRCLRRRPRSNESPGLFFVILGLVPGTYGGTKPHICAAMDGQDKPGHDALGNGTAKRSFMGVALGDLDPAAPVCVRRRGHVGLGEWRGGHGVEGWAAPVRCLGFLGGFGSWR